MDYEIKGTPLPVAICEIDEGESIVMQRGAMSWMSPNMEMKTSIGGLERAVGRMFTGESAFLNYYTAKNSSGSIAFSSHFPGRIIPVEISHGAPMIVQKSSFMACETTVDLTVHIQKKLGVGLFGGEGFVMQKLAGSGLSFVEVDGAVMDYTLEDGQSMLLSTGYLVMMDASVKIDIQMVKGFRNVMAGGQGLFITKVTGPGRIWLQTMPAVEVAAALRPYLTAGKK